MQNKKLTKGQFGYCTTSASFTCVGSHIIENSCISIYPAINLFQVSNIALQQMLNEYVKCKLHASTDLFAVYIQRFPGNTYVIQFIFVEKILIDVKLKYQVRRHILRDLWVVCGNQRIYKGESGLFLTPVLMLWGGGHCCFPWKFLLSIRSTSSKKSSLVHEL